MAFTAQDIVSDSPTNNFCTLNPLYNSSISLSDGNLTTGTFIASDGSVTSSMQMLSNEITYFEIYYETSYSSLLNIGLIDDSSNSWGIRGDGEPWNNAPQTAVSISFEYGDVLGVIVDIQTSKWYLAINGTLQLSANISNGTGYIHNNLTSNLSLRCWNASNSGNQKIRVNFGQDPTFGNASNLPNGAGDYDTDAAGNSTGGRFAFQPPTGAKALCTANLPEMTPDVAGDVPQDYFKTVIWTGQTNAGAYNNGNVTVGFQPDLVWIKNRDQADGHRLFTSSTGVHNYFQTDSASTGTSTTSLTSFNSTGFSIGTDVTVNTSGEKYVGWCWAAGSSETNNDGTIQSTIRRNVNSGISIVQYTGNGNASSTVGHGLSTVDCILGIQNISGHIHFPNILGLNYMQISFNSNATSDAGSSGTFGNFTSSTFGFRNGSINIAGVNNNGTAYTVLVFQNVEGFSKIGSYTGNGSATDGPFVYTGFRPAFLMYKNTNDSEWWAIMDSERAASNPVNGGLSPNEPDATFIYDGGGFDFLSNGFKVRGNSNGLNGSSDTHIYMAFSEQPFKFSNAR